MDLQPGSESVWERITDEGAVQRRLFGQEGLEWEIASNEALSGCLVDDSLSIPEDLRSRADLYSPKKTVRAWICSGMPDNVRGSSRMLADKGDLE